MGTNVGQWDILCLGMERDLSQKYGQNETVRKMADQQKNKKREKH